jgi:nucleotide-binding universal stress UspA family protein
MSENTVIPRRIVVGIDPSENAARAAFWAAREAAEASLPLHLVHALELPSASGTAFEPPGYAKGRLADGEKLLNRVAATIRSEYPAVAVTTEISELGPAETLMALSRNAHLVVSGTRGHGGFAGMLLGSVSQRLAAHADCPVVIVRGENGSAAVNEILLGVGPDQAESTIRFAFATAAQVGAKLHAVRTWVPYSGYAVSAGYPLYARDTYVAEDIEETSSAQEAQLDAALAFVRAQYPSVEVSTSTLRGNAVPVLCEAGRGSRLIVVGSHRHRGPLAVGAGYVVNGLLQHSSTPVAVVPIA